jgi:hypothetical protein
MSPCAVISTSLSFLRHTQYPSLDLRHGAFGWRQVGFEERGEATVLVGAGETSGDAVGVMLVACAIPAGEELRLADDNRSRYSAQRRALI